MEQLRQKLLMIDGPRAVSFHAPPLAELDRRDVRIRSAWSTFKHGTEMMAYSGQSPFTRRRFNGALRLFEDWPASEAFYPRPMGSMVVGEIEAMGADVKGLALGEQVYAWAPIADRHVLAAADVAPLGALTPDEALCIDPASFALGAVIDGAIGPAHKVLVTGLGAIGLFAVQYCRALGAHVIAASSFAKRRELAADYGAQEVHDASAHDDLARIIKEKSGGVDVAVECSGSLRTLHQTIRATRQCGTVVCVGFYGPGGGCLNLGEEFFHNRISLLASLPALSWNNPTRGKPPLRAKELQARVARDFQDKKLTARGLLWPLLPFEEAYEAVSLIADAPDKVVKVLLRHGE